MAIIVRRQNLATVDATEKQRFVDAVLELKAEPQSGKGFTNTYDRYVSDHWNAALPPEQQAGHRGPAFFPWHRWFLRLFELDLQRVMGDHWFGLPYWDWAVDQDENSPGWPFTPEFLGGNGSTDSSDGKVEDGSPFAYDTRPDGDPKKWKLNVRDESEEPTNYLKRQFQTNIGSLPTPRNVTDTLNQTPYDVNPWNISSGSGFRNWAEGWIPGLDPQMHNRVHEWVGGSMRPMTSPNDPVFFLHHCFVDKQWVDWVIQHPKEQLYLPSSGARPGHNLNDPMRPWNPPDTRVKPIWMLSPRGTGYRYDTENDMVPSEVLYYEQWIKSPNGQYQFIFHVSGDLELLRTSDEYQLWHSDTAGMGGTACAMSPSTGHLRMLDGNNNTVWESEAQNAANSVLRVQDNGYAAIYAPNGTQIWNTAKG